MEYTHVRISGLNSIDLAIQDAAYDDTFICKGIDGLGPAEIDISISGEVFQNKVPRNKQIIVRIGLNPVWSSVGGSAADLRDTLYGMLTGGYTGDRIAVMLLNIDPVTHAVIDEPGRIYGYVSKFEIVPFSKDPQVQVTIDCLSPYFESLTQVNPNLATLNKTNPSIVNPGTGPTGFYMKFTFAGLGASLPSFTISTAGGLKHMTFDPPTNFNNGHSIEFHTQYGQRFCTLYQGSDINGLAWLTSDSEWLQLYGGNNVLTMSDNHFNWDGLNFFPKFWGV